MATSKKTTSAKSSAKSSTSTKSSTGPSLPTWEDLAKLGKQFKLPSVDMSTLIEWQRKDFEAYTQAQRQLYEGMAALAQRRAEVLQEIVSTWQEAAKAGTGDKHPLAGQADAARQSLQKAMESLKELANMELQTGANAWKPVQERMQENLQNLYKLLQPKK